MAAHPYDPPGLPFGYQGAENWDSPSIFDGYKRFYEKVVKVKADVAAIFIFSPARFSKLRLTIWTRPRWHHRGEPRHRCVPAPFAGT